jgi:hypothetical protein
MVDNVELALRISADIKDVQRDVRTLRGEIKGLGRERGPRDVNAALAEMQRQGQRARSALSGLKGILATLGAALSFREIINATVRQEQAMRQLETRLRSTGGAVGYTADELAGMAAELQRTTTFGDEAIMEMQGVLLSFRRIQGPIFREATEAILDLSVGMGKDLQGAAVQVGKALEDPVKGVSALAESGVQLSEEQKKLIEGFVRMGDTASAQRIILRELQTQFGGSARAARDTLGGALTGLRNAFGDLLEAKGGVKESKEEIEKLIAILQDPRTAEAVDGIVSAVVRGLGKLVEFVAAVHFLTAGSSDEVEQLDQQVTKIDARIKQLREAAALPRAFRGVGTASGLRGEEKLFESEESILKRINALEAERTRLATRQMEILDERGRKLKEEQSTTVKQDTTGAPSKPSGPTKEEIDAANKAREALLGVNESLRQQIDAFDAADDFVLNYRLTMGDLSEEVARLGPEGQKLATSIIAQAQALEVLKTQKEADAEAERQRKKEIEEAERARQATEREGETLTARLRTAQEQYNVELARYKELLDAGAISEETFGRAQADAEKRREESKNKQDDANDDMTKRAEQAARSIESSFADFLFDPFDKGIEGMLTSFLTILRRMIAEAAAAQIIKAVMGAGGGAFAAGVFHEGGIVGEGGRTRSVSPALFVNAPRLHSGLRADEFPAILQRGEEVLAKDDARNSANGEGAGTRIINVIDPNLVQDYLSSAAGERVLVNVIQRNGGAIKQMLA